MKYLINGKVIATGERVNIIEISSNTKRSAINKARKHLSGKGFFDLSTLKATKIIEKNNPRKIKRSNKKIVVGVFNGKKNPIRSIEKIKSERYAIYSADKGKGGELPIKIFIDKNKAVHYAQKRERKTGYSTEVWFETPKGEHLTYKVYPEKIKRNPKEIKKESLDVFNFAVQASLNKKTWDIIARTKKKQAAFDYANEFAKDNPYYYVKVIHEKWITPKINTNEYFSDENP